jgi:twitching motility two-component system response regulator PilH
MKTILIVDDIQSELDLLCQYLSQAGYTAIPANNGADAIAKATENKFDAIVTDWMMPDIGGLDICRQLKKNPETEKIPIVICTVKNRDVDRFWAKKQGVQAYLIKPFTQQELLDALREATFGK